jgi:hypothetical protein
MKYLTLVIAALGTLVSSSASAQTAPAVEVGHTVTTRIKDRENAVIGKVTKVEDGKATVEFQDGQTMLAATVYLRHVFPEVKCLEDKGVCVKQKALYGESKEIRKVVQIFANGDIYLNAKSGTDNKPVQASDLTLELKCLEKICAGRRALYGESKEIRQVVQIFSNGDIYLDAKKGTENKPVKASDLVRELQCLGNVCLNDQVVEQIGGKTVLQYISGVFASGDFESTELNLMTKYTKKKKLSPTVHQVPITLNCTTDCVEVELK